MNTGPEVTGGGPRFWFSVTPELNQPNYAQVLIEVQDVYDTDPFLRLLQNRLYEGLPGVRANARRLESGPPVGIPVQIRLSGDDIPTLRARAEKLKELLREQPDTERIQDNWGGEYEEQVKGFAELSMVLIISVTAIYLALLFQFKTP